MSLFKKFIVFLIFFAMVLMVPYWFTRDQDSVHFFSRYIFHPFQSWRMVVFENVPFSVGDVFYLILLMFGLGLTCRLIFLLIKVYKSPQELGWSVMKGAYVFLTLYLILFFGWSGNYYKLSVKDVWNIQKPTEARDSILIDFDEFLIGKLNELAPQVAEESFEKIEKKAKKYYTQLTTYDKDWQGLHVKPSLFGNAMHYFKVQGYYNPFTGEAQVNKNLPDFMLPFVISHEMAHQAGIASEEDANLMAYALGTSADDVLFNYSAYFNIWMYTQHRVVKLDSLIGRMHFAKLNSTTKNHFKIINDWRLKYRTVIGKWSAQIYDSYLKMNDQKDGLKGYGNVSISAYNFEKMRLKTPLQKLPIP